MAIPALLLLLLGGGLYVASRPASKPNAAAPPPPPPPPPLGPQSYSPDAGPPPPPPPPLEPNPYNEPPMALPNLTEVHPSASQSPGIAYHPQASGPPAPAIADPWAAAANAATNLLGQIAHALPQAQVTPAPSPNAGEQHPPAPETSPGAAATPGDSPADVLGKIGKVIANAAQAGGITPTPLQTIEQSAIHDPDGSIALAAALINSEGMPGWKTANQAAVKRWQSTVGLKADGKFGPASAERMATSVGVLPVIRYWPAGTSQHNIQGKLAAYRTAIEGMAKAVDSSNPAQAAALRMSEQYEVGQGLPANPPPLNNADRIAQAVQLQSHLAGGAAS